MCQVSMGDLRQGAAAYERVLRADPACLDAWVHLAQARKEVRRGCLAVHIGFSRLPCGLWPSTLHSAAGHGYLRE